MKFNYAKEYRVLHAQGKIFSGRSVTPYKHQIAELVTETSPERMLDYGCGKGHQYQFDNIHLAWGDLKPVLYDPGVKRFSTKPVGKFQGIICTDVLEHLHMDDLDIILEDIFNYLDPSAKTSFIFFAVCCRLAKKTFSNGVNVHLIVESPTWWDEKIRSFVLKYKYPGLKVKTIYTT